MRNWPGCMWQLRSFGIAYIIYDICACLQNSLRALIGKGSKLQSQCLLSSKIAGAETE